MTVEILGVRHHGPGSARTVLGALEELAPDRIVIEGPPELDALVPLAGDPDLVPPVAGLVYAVDTPRLSSFYPFAVFSPEWVALRWAIERGVTVGFADLPATNALALSPEPAADRADRADRLDPLTLLSRTAGYDDPERWWEDVIEHRRSSSLEQFRQLATAMAEVRASDGRHDDLENARREASMRKVIRKAQRDGAERIAVVCGAYHAPALDPSTFPTVSSDNALLAKLPKVKVAATWVRRPSSPTPRATGPACARRAGTGTCSSRRRSPSCRRGSSGWPAPYATSASTPRPRRSSRPPGSRRRWLRSGAGPRSG